MLPDYLEQYMSFKHTFDNGKRYCVYGTGTWWCLKTKTVPDFMVIIHVIIPAHTEYIPVHTGMYHFLHYVPVCTGYIPGTYWYVPNTLISYNR